MPNLIGTGNNQVPTNGMLGGLAYQSPDNAVIKNLELTNLSGHNSVIPSTAVDVFVYDTRKDSDGGQWRKRTQHTSWYNETLNTATRGSRREFPAVAVIVATADDVLIYDGDDPDMPLWMKFIGSGNARAVRQGMSSITMLNGLMTAGRSGSERAVGFVNFVSDYVYQIANNGKYEFGTGGIINRNTDGSFINVSSGTQIVNNTVNDVAMTVLPNAPIDSATGLPIPTIAVATAGGVSVIRDDGTIVDHIDSAGGLSTQVAFTQDGKLAHSHDGHTGIRIDSLKSSDFNYGTNKTAKFNSEEFYINYGLISSGWSGEVPKLNNGSFSSGGQIVPVQDNILTERANTGLNLLARDFPNSPANSRVAYITSSYNTGWMHGNIKGAWLSDTSTASVTGTELHPNGNWDFSSTNVSYISNTASGTATVVSGQLQLSGGTSNYSDHIISIPTVVGKQYIITLDYVTAPGGQQIGMYHQNTNQYLTATDGGSIVARASGAKIIWYFTAVGTSTGLDLVTTGTTATIHVIDNWSIRLAEPDRSVNNNGLAVYGTLTKTAVATGSNLVAYSGFSTSNYLVQPYNSSLVAGTGSQCLMAWVYTSGLDANLRYIFTIGRQDASEQFRLGFSSSSTYFDYGGGSDYVQWSGSAIPSSSWTFVVAMVTAGQIGRLFINGVEITSPSYSVKAPSTFLTATTYITTIGTNHEYVNGVSVPASTVVWNGSLSLVRYSLSLPSVEQIAKIYNDEKALFQPNSQCTLYGSSDAVTALAYDDTTKLLSVGTSSGRSDFQGLERINNTTTAVTTAISASNGLIAEQ